MSFLKSSWTVSDYPVRIWEQPASTGHHCFCAQILNWGQICGQGQTPDEALSDLQTRISQFKQRKGYLPRPGTRVPVEMASTSKIVAHKAIADEFIAKVLGFPSASVFISNDSSLFDFESLATVDQLTGKTKQVFGVDISDIKDGNLATIFERIAGAR